MTKVLLIHPEIRTLEPPNHAPYGMLQLAAIVDSLGMKVAILDNNAFRLSIDALRQTVKEEPWDVIGIGGIISQYKAIKPIVQMCRDEHKKALIVGGGGFMTSMPFEMMHWLPEINIGSIGESHLTFREILEYAESNRQDWKHIQGIVYREGKKIKLSPMRPLIPEEQLDEEVPFPAYEFSPVETYLLHSQIPYSMESLAQGCRRLDVLASYGCPYTCSFCFHNGCTPYCQSAIYGKQVTGKAFRQHSVDYVIRLITQLRMQYYINFVSFIDENFTTNRKWFMEFCQKFEDAGLATLQSYPIHWGCLGHVRTIDSEMLTKGHDAGLSYISYGGETVSEKLLKQCHKGQNKDQMTAAITVTQSAQVNPIMTFIVGFPHTTIDEIIDDCQFYIDNQIHTIPFLLQPYPGSQLYKEYKDKIIEQSLTDEEREFIVAPTKEKYWEFFKKDDSAPLPQAVLPKEQLQILIGQLKDRALERWILSLDDAVKLSVNLTDFNDVELVGLRYLMSTWDVERLKQFKKQLEARKHEN